MPESTRPRLPHLRQSLARLVVPAVLLALLVTYAATLQTHISGSFQETTPDNILKNEYVKDVAEIQVALNVWGTIHHTGYPLFAILGNLFTPIPRLVGVEPAAAASLYALAWGIVTLAAVGLLTWRLTGRPLLAALGVVLLGVTRSVWIHHVLAEVYSMSLAITALMLLVALWPAPWEGAWSTRRRVLWLALLGGIGVSHHRAVIFVAPGLIAAVWPGRRAVRSEWRPLLIRGAALALLGFLPYIYLPLRAWQDGDWVYGEPGTLSGLWTEFSGREADRLVTLPSGIAGWGDNARSVWDILVHELSLPGLLIGIGALVLAATRSSHRHAARIIALSALGPTLFALAYHTAVLPQAILMPTVLALVLGVVLTVDWLATIHHRISALALAGLLAWSGMLVAWHYDYVETLVSESSGLDTIARLDQLPREGQPALMLPWGPRYAAASYSRLVTGENADVMMVDHKANYPQLLADGYQLYTEPETFYTYPPPWPTQTAYGGPSDWWTRHLGQLYLTSAGPDYVQLQVAPWLAEPGDRGGTPVVYGITRRDAWLTCDEATITLHVIWGANQRPTGDPSVFVHLQGDELAPNPPNADRRHPVHGLYPFVQWSPGEIVRDDFSLPRLPDKTQVIFGLYESDSAGQTVNYGTLALPVDSCRPAPP